MNEKITHFLSLFNVRYENGEFKSTIDFKRAKTFNNNKYLIFDGKYIRGRFKNNHIQMYEDEETSYATIIKKNTIYKYGTHIIDEHRSAEEIDISKINSNSSVTFKLYFDDRNYKEILRIEIYDSNERIVFITISSITSLITFIDKSKGNVKTTLLISNETDNLIAIITSILERNLAARKSTLLNPTLKSLEHLRFLIELALERANQNTDIYIEQIEEEKEEFIARKNAEIQGMLKKQSDFLKREKPKKSDKK